MYFNLCDLQTGSETEDCFAQYPLKTISGNLNHDLGSTETGYYNVTLQLPSSLTCTHCVLQWTYNVGNSWGYCDDGTGRLGCGPQENFRTCSDIYITGKYWWLMAKWIKNKDNRARKMESLLRHSDAFYRSLPIPFTQRKALATKVPGLVTFVENFECLKINERSFQDQLVGILIVFGRFKIDFVSLLFISSPTLSSSPSSKVLQCPTKRWYNSSMYVQVVQCSSSPVPGTHYNSIVTRHSCHELPPSSSQHRIL